MSNQDSAQASAGSIDVARWRERIRATTFSSYHLEMGAAIERTGGAAAAVTCYARAVEADPSCTEAHAALVDLLGTLGRVAEAETAEVRAQTAAPRYRERGLLRRALRFAGRRDFDRGAELLASIASSAEGIVGTGVLNALRAEMAPTIESDALTRLDHDDRVAIASSLSPLMPMLKAAGAVEAMASLVATLTALDPAIGPIEFELAELLYGCGDLDRCLMFFGRGVERLRAPTARHAYYAGYLIRAGRGADALDFMDGLTAEAPENGAFRSFRGAAALAAGDLETALADFRRARELGTTAVWNRQYEGMALVALGRRDEAVGVLADALRESPDSAHVRSAQGYPLHLESRWSDAERIHRAALEASPDDPWLLLDMAAVLQRQGRSSDARAALSRALERDRHAVRAFVSLCGWYKGWLAPLFGELGFPVA